MVNLFVEVNKKLKEENKKWDDIKYAITRIGDDWVSHPDLKTFTQCAFYTNYEQGILPKARLYGASWFTEVM